jgi:hypothetical protein
MITPPRPPPLGMTFRAVTAGPIRRVSCLSPLPGQRALCPGLWALGRERRGPGWPQHHRHHPAAPCGRFANLMVAANVLRRSSRPAVLFRRACAPHRYIQRCERQRRGRTLREMLMSSGGCREGIVIESGATRPIAAGGRTRDLRSMPAGHGGGDGWMADRLSCRRSAGDAANDRDRQHLAARISAELGMRYEVRPQLV